MGAPRGAKDAWNDSTSVGFALQNPLATPTLRRDPPPPALTALGDQRFWRGMVAARSVQKETAEGAASTAKKKNKKVGKMSNTVERSGR